MVGKSKGARWTTADASALYQIAGWGHDFFSVGSEGTVQVHPEGAGGPSVDLAALVEEVRERGIELPLLIRFSEIVKARVEELHQAFGSAIESYGYGAPYQGVYPIKVNQNRYLVERLVEYGRAFHYGLEAGSKAELLAVMAMLSDPQALVICNGYKDEEYVRTALLAAKLGPKVVLVVEKRSELRLIQQVVEGTGLRPCIGIRARLATRGSGYWQESGGEGSKFGLSARGLIEAVTFLREKGMLDCFELLHFHIGSQISTIRSVKDALREASRLYANLSRMGAPLAYLDVGGGLGVDYDGSGSSAASSINYSLQEYANDVVFGVMDVCDAEGIEHPVLVSESGRAVVAHHAALIVETLGVAETTAGKIPDELPEDVETPLRNLHDSLRDLNDSNLLEMYHDAQSYRDECLSLFSLGHMPLEHRGLAEDMFLRICQRVLERARAAGPLPEELRPLEDLVSDTYFGNWSIFQSLPDAWAIGQLFPVMPIHRLNERPTRSGTLVDISCDSDGKISRFIDGRESKALLELHAPEDDKPYYLGVFLVGAYQEALGDLHNLFGDTNVIQVSIDGEDPEGGYTIEGVEEGDTVSDVLGYLRYSRKDLMARVRRAAEHALRGGRLDRDEAKQLLEVYEAGLSGYTYLEP